jgi:hypothetical protein
MYLALGDRFKRFFLARYSIVVVGSSVDGGSRLALLLGRKKQCMHANRRFELKIDCVIEYSYLIVIYNEEVNVILKIQETLNVMLSRGELARHANKQIVPYHFQKTSIIILQ